MMDAKEFKEITGDEPELDDLDRVNCKLAGEAGHSSCGMCPVHNKPRFRCGCIAKPKSNS